MKIILFIITLVRLLECVTIVVCITRMYVKYFLSLNALVMLHENNFIHHNTCKSSRVSHNSSVHHTNVCSSCLKLYGVYEKLPTVINVSDSDNNIHFPYAEYTNVASILLV